MDIYTIDNTKKLIRFIIPLFYEETGIAFNSDESVDYFVSGGCYELAKIVKHYFPDTEYVVRNDHDHVAILESGVIYDAYDFYEDWQLKARNIKEKYYKKDLKDFYIATEEEIDNFPVEFNREDKINGLTVSEKMIEVIDEIPSVKVKRIKKGLK